MKKNTKNENIEGIFWCLQELDQLFGETKELIHEYEENTSSCNFLHEEVGDIINEDDIEIIETINHYNALTKEV